MWRCDSLKELSKKLKLKRTWQLHVMMVPIVVLLVIFCYVPMIGIVVSFQDYLPTKGFFGSPWVGLDNYRFLFSLNDFFQIIRNTLIISGGKILLGLIISIFFAIMLYESNMRIMKNVVQTSVFLPYFLSWVVLGGIFIDIFSLEGVVNRIISFLGIEPVMFMGHPIWFVIVIIITDVWKVYGYNMIVFYAAIMGIDTALYESATIDGAGRIRQVFAITLPSIAPMIVVMGMLSLGNILNAGFDQIFNMYNPTVMSTADILDTYIYRMGVVSGQYSFATAVGFFKSIVAMILIVTSNWAAKRFAGYRIF
ncbi:MAG: sugar ABC transporter permease [Clostridiales bacterium]|nr:sugar ABC transporter permease [Clostridiales bacterium]